MINPDDIFNVITRNTDAGSKRKVYSEMNEDPGSRDLLKKVKIIWAFMSSSRKMPEYKLEESYRMLHARISRTTFFDRMVPAMRYAAMIMLVAGISALSYYLGKTSMPAIVDKESDHLRYTSVVADNGQISRVILPDSSVVWLNSGTKLSYDNNYSYQNRNLELTGQAFLQVKKDPDLPLVVTSGNLKIKVLGTRFDVNAYPDEELIKVTLESGRVELANSIDKSFNYQLVPGQMAEFNSRTNEVEVKHVDVQDYTCWKDGELIFTDASMREVIKRLERKFDLKIEVTSPNVYNSVFNARFKNEDLKEILDYIQYSCLVTYQLIPGRGTSQDKVILSYKN